MNSHVVSCMQRITRQIYTADASNYMISIYQVN